MYRFARAFALLAVIGIYACSDAANAEPASQDTSLPQLNIQLNGDPGPPPNPSVDPNAPSLDLRIIKSMIYSDAMKNQVNPYLVMGLAWHESGWQASVVSSAGAVGIMQVMPSTAAADGPLLLNRSVNLFDPGDNIDMGAAIIKHNLDSYHNDLAKALTAYYAGGGAVTDWVHLRADCRHYVWAVYNAAMMFKEGKGPV